MLQIAWPSSGKIIKLYARQDPCLPVGEVGQVVGILQRHAVPLLVESNPGPGELQQPIHKLALLPLLNKQGKCLNATDKIVSRLCQPAD